MGTRLAKGSGKVTPFESGAFAVIYTLLVAVMGIIVGRESKRRSKGRKRRCEDCKGRGDK